MFVRKMLAARALPLTALGLAAWCPAYAVEEPVKADGRVRDRHEGGEGIAGRSHERFRHDERHQAFSRPDHRRACRTPGVEIRIPAGRALSAYPSAARINRKDLTTGRSS